MPFEYYYLLGVLNFQIYKMFIEVNNLVECYYINTIIVGFKVQSVLGSMIVFKIILIILVSLYKNGVMLFPYILIIHKFNFMLILYKKARDKKIHI